MIIIAAYALMFKHLIKSGAFLLFYIFSNKKDSDIQSPTTNSYSAHI